MLFLRSLLFSLYMIASTILIGTLAILFFPLPYKIRYAMINIYATSIVQVLRIVCGVRYQVEGRENIRHPALIFSKHQSTWETYILQLIFPPISFVFKSELLWVPFFGWGLAAMKPISIDRGSGRKAVRQLVNGGIKRLRENLSVVIFPEGTRTQPTGPGRYRIGGAVLAAESGYPVIPVAHNAGECWRRKSFIKRPGLITVRIGPAIESKGKTPEAILAAARDWIEAQMPDITQGPYQSN
jgi:1-acyl-sn-glycerol-3-phosphate acyltransferase